MRSFCLVRDRMFLFFYRLMMAIEASGCAILLQVVLVIGISQAAVFNINAVLNSGKNFAGLHPADDYPIVST